MRTSIGLKLTTAVVGLMLFSLFAFAYISIWVSQGTLSKNLQDDLNSETHDKVELIQIKLNSGRTFASDLATAVESGQYNEEELNRLIHNMLERNDQVYGSTVAYEPDQFKLGVYYWSPYYYRTPENNLEFVQLGNPEYDYLNQAWYLLPKQNLTPILSPPYFDKDGGEIWMVTWSVPVFDPQGKFIAVATADIDFSQIQNTFTNLQVGRTGYAFLLDSKGTILGIGDRGGNFEVLVDSMVTAGESRVAINWAETINSMLAGKNGYSEAVDVNGVPLYVAYAPVGLDTGWSLGLAYPREEILEQSTSLQGTLIGYSFLLAFVIGIIIFLFTRSITNPLRLLTQIASQIAMENPETVKEQLSNPIQIETQDEIEDLAGAFNQMVKNLRQSLESLEEKVAERTWDLQTSRLQTERRASELQSISEIATLITAEQKLEVLLTLVTRLVSERFGFYHTGIFLLDDTKQYAVLRAANSEGGQRMLKRGHKLKSGESGIVGYVAASGQPRIALDVGQDAVFFNNPDLPNTRSEMAIPLNFLDETIGVLDVQSEKPGAFSEDDTKTLKTLADQISIAIQNTRSFEQTQRALDEIQTLYRQNLQADWKVFSREEGMVGYQQGLTGGKKLVETVNTSEIQQVANRGETLIFHADGKTSEPTLVVPIKLRGQIIGVIHIKAPSKDRLWTSNEVNLSEAVSERLSLALENARLIQESQRQAVMEQAISEITGKIGSSINLENVLQTAVEELGRTIPGSEVLIKIQSNDMDEGE